MALRPTLTDGLPLSWTRKTALAVDGEIHQKGRPDKPSLLKQAMTNVDYGLALSNREE
jgi:hypothetical protein